MKLVLNDWLASLTEGIAETIALTEALGLDPDLFMEAIGDGRWIGICRGKGAARRSAGKLDPGFALHLAYKDGRPGARCRSCARPGAPDHRSDQRNAGRRRWLTARRRGCRRRGGDGIAARRRLRIRTFTNVSSSIRACQITASGVPRSPCAGARFSWGPRW